MKVKCINSSGEWVEFKKKSFFRKEKWVKSTGPKYGDIVTVTEQTYHEGVLYYEFLEWPSKKPADPDTWIAEMFTPLQEQLQAVTYSELISDKPVSAN